MSDKESKPFELIVVVPDPDENGVIDPKDNRYYRVTQDHILQGERIDPREVPHDWVSFVSQDVDMAHYDSSSAQPFGTFLVNMAAFFDKKRTPERK